MKKKTEKKLKLEKIKIATLNANNKTPFGVILTLSRCTNDISQTAPVCSEDSCRF